MALSRVIKRQSKVCAFGKVSKTASKAAAAYVKSTQQTVGKVTELPLVELENQEKFRPTTAGKRKRDTEDDGKSDDNEEGATFDLPLSKKPKTTPNSPDILQDLTELHKHF